MRVDCTFSSEMMAAILKKPKGSQLLLSEGLELFSSTEEANKMVRDLFVYSGIPKLIALPSMISVDRGVLEEDEEILRVWKEDPSLWDSRTWRLMKPWNRDVAERFWREYRLDMTIPYEVYCVMDRTRLLCSCSNKEHVFALEASWSRGERVTERVRELRRELTKSAAKSALSLRRSLFGVLPHERVRTNSRRFGDYRDRLLEVEVA